MLDAIAESSGLKKINALRKLLKKVELIKVHLMFNKTLNSKN
jgi:hypothetical protein